MQKPKTLGPAQLCVVSLLLPNPFIDETQAQKGWEEANLDHTARTVTWGWVREDNSSVDLYSSLVPNSQQACLECKRDLSQRECPFPRP